jgi:hypothetical protein
MKLIKLNITTTTTTTIIIIIIIIIIIMKTGKFGSEKVYAYSVLVGYLFTCLNSQKYVWA